MARDNIISPKFRGFPRTIRCTISIYTHDTRRPTSIQVSRAHDRPDSPATSQVHESARPEASVRSLRNDRWQDSSWNDKKKREGKIEREREKRKKGEQATTCREYHRSAFYLNCSISFRSFYLNLYIYLVQQSGTKFASLRSGLKLYFVVFDWQIF